MRIYFAGAIRGGRGDVSMYHALISYLAGFGDVVTEHVGDASLTEEGDDGPDDRFIFARDMEWLKTSDLLVAEVSIPSHGVGYEVGYAVALKKPVLCLRQSGRGRRLSAMIAGNPGVVAVEYASLKEATEIIDSFIKEGHLRDSE